jgi:cyclin G-associated kinase
MYRAPEMLDLYSNFPINMQSDVWALGCILYVLCFNKHPFEDAAKLRIINGNYVIPTNPEFDDYHDLISNNLEYLPALNPP